MSVPMEPLSAGEVEERYQDAKQYVGITKTTICELCESHERLRDEVSKAGWQPIDTAPKGETRVDLWCGGMLRVTNCRWSDEGNCWENEWGQVLVENLIPTHWMPTPAPPKEIA